MFYTHLSLRQFYSLKQTREKKKTMKIPTDIKIVIESTELFIQGSIHQVLFCINPLCYTSDRIQINSNTLPTISFWADKLIESIDSIINLIKSL